MCNEFNLSYDYDEVYEHWAIESRFASELESRGYLTFEFSNFTVWGRMTTGQSISLDYVVRQIVTQGLFYFLLAFMSFVTYNCIEVN